MGMGLVPYDVDVLFFHTYEVVHYVPGYLVAMRIVKTYRISVLNATLKLGTETNNVVFVLS